MVKQDQRRLPELLDSYREYLLSRVSKVRILGEAHERELKDVFVELSIVDQRAPEQHAEFLGLMDSTMRRRLNPFAEVDREDAAPERPSAHEKETKRRVRPDELLRRRMKAIITGAPGCGKTTLLKYLALQAQEQEQLAVWLELKAIDRPLFAQAEAVAARNGHLILPELWLKYLQAQLSLSAAEIKLLHAHWQEKFKANEITVLLDGFDELQDEAIEHSLNKCVGQFASSPHDNTLLISSRPYAQARLGHERLQELEIEPLNQRQIEAFLNCYYPNDDATKSFLKTLSERSSLRELLHVPLLLGVVLRLHRENSFTDERLKLYEAIIVDLVHKLDRSKSVYRPFKINDEELRLDFLKFLAFERLLRDSLEEGEQEANRIVFSYDLLKEKARTFLAQEYPSHNPRDLANDALATPLLREVGTDAYAFTHLTLQEYLAARAFAVFYQKRVNEFEGLKIFCRAYHNPTVVEMEVLPMMLGASSDPDKLCAEIERWPESLTFANLRLRARGLGYSARIRQDRLSKLIERLLEFIEESVSGDTPFQEIVINSFVGMHRQAINLMEGKAEMLIKLTYVYAEKVSALAKVGSDRAVDALISALTDGDNRYRSKAASALGMIASEKSVDVLVSALADQETAVRSKAASALGMIASEKTVDVLVSALADQETAVRSMAASALGCIGSDDAVDHLSLALSDKDITVRLYAASALGQIGSDKAFDALIAALNHNSNNVRMKAASMLGNNSSEKAIEALRCALNDDDKYVRSRVASALTQTNSDGAVDILISALSDKDTDLRSYAIVALGRVSSKKAVEGCRLALKDENQHVRVAAALALGQTDSDKSVSVLISVLNNEDGPARKAAVSALGQIDSNKGLETLMSALNDKDGHVRLSAASALGRIDSDKAVSVLLSALKNTYSHESLRAARILAHMSALALRSGLMQTIERPNESVWRKDDIIGTRFSRPKKMLDPLFARKKAVAVIGYYSNDKQTLDQLMHLAQTDKDDEVREAAREAAERFARKLELSGHLWPRGTAEPLSDSASKEGVLVHEVGLIVSAAGHFFREVLKYDEGIDGEIEFRDAEGRGSGQRVYLQLKSGDSYLVRQKSGKEIFRIKKPRHAQYWFKQPSPVLLVIRNADGRIRWMNVSEYLQHHGTTIKQIEFQGEPFTAGSVKEMRDRFAR